MAELFGLDKMINKKQEEQKNKKPSLRSTLQATQEPGIRSQVASPEEAGVPSFVPDVPVPGPKEVQQRTQEKKEIEQLISAPELEKPESLDKVFNKINQISTGLPPEQKTAFETQRAKIEEAKNKAFEQYQQDKNQAQWLQVAETLGQALVQLGAGAYGLKHNVDLSGLRFNKNDWAKNLDQVNKELDQKLGRISQEERQVERASQEELKRFAEDADFRKRSILQDFMTRQRGYQDQVLQAQRLAERLQKQEAAGEAPSAQEKAQQRELIKQQREAIKQDEQELKLLDKALAEANAAKEGEGKASLESVAKILGGEKGEQFRTATKTPFSIWSPSTWLNSDEDEAPKVIKGYMEQTRKALQEKKKALQGLVFGEDGQEVIQSETSSPSPEKVSEGDGPEVGTVVEGYRFKGGNPANQENWEKVK